jgi:hypothetical protein
MAVKYSVAMMKTTLTALIIAGLASPAFAQAKTAQVVGITAAEIEAVAKPDDLHPPGIEEVTGASANYM